MRLKMVDRLMPGFGRTQTLLALLVGATMVAGALVVGARSVFFPPRFRGFGEVTAGGQVAGWVVDGQEETTARPVEVQLYIDGVFAAAATADLPRPDVLAAGRARDERCGYSFALPTLAAGEHEARVYAAHAVGGGAYRTLQQTGAALRFRVGQR
ncbi:MAG TPA: hypothetical protein VF240_07775 [Pyrinomonadaceae bacterium]